MVWRLFSQMAVAIKPGAIELTRIPRGPQSAASARHGVDGALGTGIGNTRKWAADASHRADVDDRATAAGNHRLGEADGQHEQ